MSLASCPFCTHSNPAGARFCNECGSPLHLLPCEHCEAVNDVLSRVCYRCGAPLRSERQHEPLGAPVLASFGDATVEREATTVVLAYGDEPRASPRPIVAWRPSGTDIERQPLSKHEQAAAHEVATADEREPLLAAPAADDDKEGRAARRVSTSAGPYLTFVAAVAIVGLAALGGYTFIQRGEAPPEEPPLPMPIAAPAPGNSTTPAELPQPREPAPPESDVPTASPPKTSPPTASQPTTSPPAESESQPTSDASPGVGPDTGKVSAAESPPKADRRPAPVTKPSQDAIETQRIIMRELGGFAPPTR